MMCITGDAGINSLFGDSGNDVINGGDGGDYILGGVGADILNGGGGEDFFYLETQTDMAAGETYDGGTGSDTLLLIFPGDNGPAVDLSALSLTSVERIDADIAGNIMLSVAQLGRRHLSPCEQQHPDHVRHALAEQRRASRRAHPLGGGQPGRPDRRGRHVVPDLGPGGADTVTGGSGAAYIDGGAGNDTITGGGNADRLIGGTGADHLSGSGGNDVIDGNDDDDVIDGGAGDDQIDGGLGSDTLNGEGDNDLLVGGLGADTISGGAGIDMVSYEDNQGGVFVNLTLGQGFGNAAAGDVYIGIENARGSIFNDTIIGDGGANRLEGGGGNDVLRGAFGADALVGGAGNDTASYEDNQGAVFVNLLTGQGFNNAAQGDSFDSIENLAGSIYADYFIGTNGVNTLSGGDGNDTLLGALGADVLIGGVGSDTASYEDNQGAVFVNLTLGQGFGNAAEGDTFSSIENLVGTVFYDTFIGDGNANRLDGALGNDTLTGAGGADTFVFDTAFAFNNIDEIVDFTHGTDKIELENAIFTGLAAGTLSADAFAVGAATTLRSLYPVQRGHRRPLYDADGSGAGAAIQFATLQEHLTITNTDFIVA